MSRSVLSRIDQNVVTTNLAHKPHMVKETSMPLKLAPAPIANQEEVAKLKADLLRQEKIVEQQKSLIADLRKSLMEAVRVHEQNQEQIRSLSQAVSQISPLQSHLTQISMMYSLIQMQ